MAVCGTCKGKAIVWVWSKKRQQNVPIACGSCGGTGQTK